MTKRLFDIGFALVLLIVLFPLLLVLALLVAFTSPGGAFFRQTRTGKEGKEFRLLKFRTMRPGSETKGQLTVGTRDPRVTSIGVLLRRSKLDELPQLFNVLTGQLSLVGPRPHATQAKAADTLYEKVVDGYFARHKVKPGITGWAQINGWRGETDTREKLEQRVKYDLEYIDRWSLLLDLYIIFKTPFALLKSENAY